MPTVESVTLGETPAEQFNRQMQEWLRTNPPLTALAPNHSTLAERQIALLQELLTLVRLQTEHAINPPPDPPEPPPTEAQQQAAEERRLWDLEYKTGFRRSRDLGERQIVAMERQAVALENIATLLDSVVVRNNLQVSR